MKSALLYLVLVGLPLLGLFWILQAGERLTAPPAIGGTWRLSAAVQGQECVPPAGPGPDATLEISQSGRYLALRLAGAGAAEAVARLEGSRLRAAFAAPAHGPCEAASSPVLEVDLVRTAGAVDRLEGRWSWPGCTACAPVPFTATRPLAD